MTCKSKLKWYTYFLLLMVYVVYLGCGAFVFKAIEQPAEIEKCVLAKNDIKEKISQFGNEYFYTLGLNKKFCGGIDFFLSNETAVNLYDSFIVNLLRVWKDEGCNQVAYGDLVRGLEVKQDDEELMRQYSTVWQQCQHLADMKQNFDDEVITMSGKTLRMIMKKTAHFGVNNYLRLENDCHEKWNYHNSFFFAGTLATTIGYGNNAPETQMGKLFCLVFILIGIPYFAYMMSIISDLINAKMEVLRHRIQSARAAALPCYIIPLAYTLLGFILLVIVPSVIFTLMEDWSFLDAVYYSFISLSTIGFGDFVPRNEPPTQYAEHLKNDTACFEELINPIPSNDVNLKTGLTNLCNPTTWPKEIEAVFNMYRVGVFFWILAGLVWLGGVISIITELIRMRGHNMSGDETKKCSVINSEKDCFLR